MNAKATDLSTYFELSKNWSDGWRRLKAASCDQWHFEFSELMGSIERTCHLYNKNMLSPASGEMISELIKETLPYIFESDDLRDSIIESFSGESTYIEIEKFCKKNNIINIYEKIRIMRQESSEKRLAK